MRIHCFGLRMVTAVKSLDYAFELLDRVVSGANAPIPHVPVRVTRRTLIAHRYTYEPPRCRTSQYRRTFYSPVSISME